MIEQNPNKEYPEIKKSAYIDPHAAINEVQIKSMSSKGNNINE